eukprot:Lankesteria_metandrocarpae@DN2645_c0_g1_i3.p1
MIAATLTIIAVVVLPSLVVAPYDVARHDGSVRRKPIRYIGVSTLDGEQPLEMENIISPMNTGLHTEATDKNGLPILSSQGTRLLRRPQTRSSRELANEDRTTASAIEANIKYLEELLGSNRGGDMEADIKKQLADDTRKLAQLLGNKSPSCDIDVAMDWEPTPTAIPNIKSQLMQKLEGLQQDVNRKRKNVEENEALLGSNRGGDMEADIKKQLAEDKRQLKLLLGRQGELQKLQELYRVQQDTQLIQF